MVHIARPGMEFFLSLVLPPLTFLSDTVKNKTEKHFSTGYPPEVFL